jgi:hypothetical protein
MLCPLTLTLSLRERELSDFSPSPEGEGIVRFSPSPEGEGIVRFFPLS